MDRKCTICQEAASKYKCSTCRIPYCSLTCYKSHKEIPCQNMPPPETEPVMKNKTKKNKEQEIEEEEEDNSRLSQEQLQLLAQSPQIKSLLKHKKLRELISKIDESSQPEKILETIRSEDEGFEEFLQLLLQTTDPMA
ncbi:unnamed protein product [Cunninghamella echinulata]